MQDDFSARATVHVPSERLDGGRGQGQLFRSDGVQPTEVAVIETGAKAVELVANYWAHSPGDNTVW